MRVLLGELEKAFEALHAESNALLDRAVFSMPGPDENPRSETTPELIVRSAARVEQCFGGVATRLWDDPFEWTLPENLSDKAAVRAYLSEVKQVRENGFRLFTSDRDLTKKISVAEEMTTIFEVLLNALTEANRRLAVAARNAETER